jgi:hypothetical protein
LRAAAAAQVVICVATLRAEVVQAERVRVVRDKTLPAPALDMAELVESKPPVVRAAREALVPNPEVTARLVS